MGSLYLTFLATSLLYGNQLGFAIKEDLVQLNDCVCPQYQLRFECTVLGGDFTFWKGTLFNCASNRIILRHDEFSNQEGSSGECNNGAVVATSIAADANNMCYTSQLSIQLVTQDMDNRTIVCINEDGPDSETNHTITLRLTRDPPPSPSNIHLRSFNQSELTFAWDAVLTNCIAIHYAIISTCGHCPSTTPNTFITCTNPNTSGNNTCRFSVQPVVCGNVRGNESRPLYVSPRVLDPPVMNLLPKVFCSEQTMTLDISFNKTRPFNISSGIDGSAVSYTVTYSEATSGNICGSATISTSSCDDRVCRYLLGIDLASSCLSSTRSVRVTAFATNILGNGPRTVPAILVVPQCDHGTGGSGLTAAISTYSILLLLAGLSIAVLIIILVVLVRERARLSKELEAAKEFSTYEDVDIPQFSNEAPKTTNVGTEKNISYCPVSST